MSTANHAPLGFGLMRLPKVGEEIDVAQTSQMVDAFLAAGFTYFDTAYVYTGSEDAIRKALVERHPRDSYTLATKLNARGSRHPRIRPGRSWKRAWNAPAPATLTTTCSTHCRTPMCITTTTGTCGTL